MLCESALDAFEMRSRIRQVLTELCFPSLFISRNPLSVARRESAGIDSSVLGLGFEESGCFGSFHSRVRQRPVTLLGGRAFSSCGLGLRIVFSYA